MRDGVETGKNTGRRKISWDNGTGSAIFHNYTKLSRKYEIKLTLKMGASPPSHINSSPVYYNKNKGMELLKRHFYLGRVCGTVKPFRIKYDTVRIAAL